MLVLGPIGQMNHLLPCIAQPFNIPENPAKPSSEISYQKLSFCCETPSETLKAKEPDGLRFSLLGFRVWDLYLRLLEALETRTSKSAQMPGAKGGGAKGGAWCACTKHKQARLHGLGF